MNTAGRPPPPSWALCPAPPSSCPRCSAPSGPCLGPWTVPTAFPQCPRRLALFLTLQAPFHQLPGNCGLRASSIVLVRNAGPRACWDLQSPSELSPGARVQEGSRSTAVMHTPATPCPHSIQRWHPAWSQDPERHRAPQPCPLLPRPVSPDPSTAHIVSHCPPEAVVACLPIWPFHSFSNH